MLMRIYDFIFSNKISIRILRHFAFWLSWYLYQVLLFLYNNSNVQNTFWSTLITRLEKLATVMPVGVSQCYIIVYWLIPSFLLKRKYFVFLIGIIISSAAVIYIVDILTYDKFDFLSVWTGIKSYISRATPTFVLIFIMIKMVKTWYLKECEKDILLKENLSAELQLLKAQVHPHFLFNTLNNIYAFILSDCAKAQACIKKLEKILRYMITECNQPLVQLSKEISMINDYTELEKVRYGNSLTIEVTITSSEDKLIAPLLMIPFIENSFKHGASKMLRKPWIHLNIQADESMLHFTLINAKPAAEEHTSIKNGIGLTNVKKRLELLYAQNHLLTINDTPNTFTVNMQVPIATIKKNL